MSNRILSIGESDIAYLGVQSCLAPAGLEVVGGPVAAANAIDAVGRLEPDLVLIRLIASDVAGYLACRELASFYPKIPVVLCVIEPDGHDAADAIHAGARACLDARLSCEELRQSIQVVLAGGSLFTADQLVSSRLAEPLTHREIDVLRLAGLGLGLDETAERLGTQPGTVRNQLAEARSKLDVRTTRDAVIRALRRGLIDAV